MKQIIRKTPYIILVLVVFLIAFLVPVTYSWLSHEGSKDGSIDIGDIGVNINAFFEYEEDGRLVTKNAYSFTDAPNCYDSIKGLFTLNGALKSAVLETGGEYNPNFLDDFKVSITVNPEVSSYIRVKVYDEWIVERTYHSFDEVQRYSIYHEADYLFPFRLADESWRTVGQTDFNTNWYYDADTKYVYYTIPLQKNTEVTLPFIYGGDSYIPKISRVYSDTCSLVMNIRVEVVQANRFSQIWGITSIPDGGN